jgi:putative addiction module component (TIGR02574 family)
VSDILTPEKLDTLSVDDRLAMIDAVWDSLCRDPDSVPIPDWHIEELQRRLTHHAVTPLEGRDWSEVQAELLKRLA